MRPRLLTFAVLLLAALAAAPALAQGPRGRRVNPHYRAQPYHRIQIRSRFMYRDPYEWEAKKNLLRYNARPYGYYRGAYESYYYGGGQRFIRW